MNNNTEVRATGISFTGLLQVAFIVLKLLNKITWSWFWVLSPTWISIIVVIIVIVIMLYIIGK